MLSAKVHSEKTVKGASSRKQIESEATRTIAGSACPLAQRIECCQDLRPEESSSYEGNQGHELGLWEAINSVRAVEIGQHLDLRQRCSFNGFNYELRSGAPAIPGD